MSSPSSGDPLAQAMQLLQAGDRQGAEAWVLQTIEREPDQPGGWRLLGKLLREQGQLGDAVEAYLRAASLDHGDIGSRSELGYLFSRMSLTEEAIHWHGEALALQPDDLLLRLNHCFVLPVVASGGAQIESLRQRSLEGLQALVGRRFAAIQGSHTVIHHPFHLLYHNRNDRAVLESYGQLLSSHLPIPDSPRSAPSERQRRRIGFLSGYFYQHSNSYAFEGLIRHLDRRRFEVVVIHLSPSPQDPIRARIDACADASLVLSPSLKPALDQLKALDLDLLYFTDIGMNAFSTLLACRRSAPLQLTGWGIPQTSGLSSIDHYISASLVEPPGAQEHYSEKLVLLPGLPSCYLRDNLSTTQRDRDYFFLPNDAAILGCLQTLWKLHPDFDGVLERIAQRLPEAWFVFIESEITSHTQIFLERIERSAPTLAQRLILLSRLSREDYIALAGCLDLLLDPIHFSSGVSFYDTIHTGTPMICLEGEFLRSRYAAAAYRLMGLADAPVARDPDHYIELTVALAQDPLRRAALRDTIRERAHAHLYDRLDGVEAFADFALESIERLRQDG